METSGVEGGRLRQREAVGWKDAERITSGRVTLDRERKQCVCARTVADGGHGREDVIEAGHLCWCVCVFMYLFVCLCLCACRMFCVQTCVVRMIVGFAI